MTSPGVAAPYKDIEQVLCGWATQALGARVLTELPADLRGQVPLLQIERLGGADTRPGLDEVVLDTDAYGPDRASAISLAELARWNFRFVLPGTQIEDLVFTRVDTITGPTYRPYDNTNVRRIGAEYRIYVHTVAI